MATLRTVRQIDEDSNLPYTAGQLRWWAFNRGNNGLDQAGAVHFVGRRMFVDIDALEDWITSGAAAQSPSRCARGAA